MVLRSCLLLLLAGCLPKDPAIQAATPIAVAVGAELTHVDDGAVTAFPPEASDRVQAALRAHNLSPQVVDITTTRNDSAQIDLMRASGAPWTLEIESRARFFSQMNGRYRWTVTTELSLHTGERVEDTLLHAIETPVFLEYAHEGEPEALIAAMPMIEREISAMLQEALTTP